MKINYTDFQKELNKQFSTIPHLITECLIRHWFIETQKINAEIEVPYYRSKAPFTPIKLKTGKKTYIKNSRFRADLYVNGEDTVIEFKYHRQTKYSNIATATNMGEVFNDLNRLSLSDNEEKYFIYVFDQKMKDYYEKHSPFDMLKISEIKVGNTYKIDDKKDKVIAGGYAEFKKVAFKFFPKRKFKDFDYIVRVEYANKICDDYYLIVYKVD